MTTSADVITKLQTDLLKLVPASGVEHTTINVLAGILSVTANELAPLLDAKIDASLLWEGLSNVETGIAQTVTGGEQIAKAMKGPAEQPVADKEAPIEGNA